MVIPCFTVANERQIGGLRGHYKGAHLPGDWGGGRCYRCGRCMGCATAPEPHLLPLGLPSGDGLCCHCKATPEPNLLRMQCKYCIGPALTGRAITGEVQISLVKKQQTEAKGAQTARHTCPAADLTKLTVMVFAPAALAPKVPLGMLCLRE